jgi:hypothetical protein
MGFMVKTRAKRLCRLVLDVLKPHSPTLPEFASKLSSIPGVEGVGVTLVEINKETESVRVTIEGELDYSRVFSAIEEGGSVIHSVDEVLVGRLSGARKHSHA